MKLPMMVHGLEVAHNMEVLSQKHPGIMIICQGCGAVLANIQRSDIYGANLVYCPLCKFQNLLEYDRNYDGIIENPKNLEENAKES